MSPAAVRLVVGLLVPVAVATKGHAQHVVPAGASRVPVAVGANRRALPEVDAAMRDNALLGALVGGIVGAYLGAITECREQNPSVLCHLSGGADGLPIGTFGGSVLGAWEGGGSDRCGWRDGLLRATAGALAGSAPYVVHRAATGRREGIPALGFVLYAMTPFMQAEGAAMAVSAC